METKKDLRERVAKYDTYRASAEERASKLTNDLADAKKSHAAELDLVIDALGIRDSYPDIETQKKAWGTRAAHSYSYHPYGPRYESYEYEYTQTDYGRDRFLADVKASRKAKKGAEAVARITAALKSAK